MHSTVMLKLKFMQISAMLNIVNNALDTIIYSPEEILGIVDLRSLGYNKIKQGILQQNLSTFYRFEKADTICEQFNKFINTLKKERQQEELDPSNERKYMTDREMLEKICRFRKKQA